MRAMLTIAKREFRSYFDSPLAYVVICACFALLGALFFFIKNGFWAVDRATMQSMFEYSPWGIVLLVVPVITMRLVAEEKRSGTLEMLITLPVKDSDVIIGKYLGALGLVLVLVTATLVYPLALFYWPWNLGVLDMGPVWAGYLGLVLLSAASVAIGLLISSLTDSQPVAAVLTFVLLLVLWFVLGYAAETAGAVGNILNYLSFQKRLEGFTRGLIDTRDVVFFLSITLLCLLVAFRALERRKWA